jgi:hypothetical protein
MPEFRTGGLHSSRFGGINCGEHGAVLFAVSKNGLMSCAVTKPQSARGKRAQQLRHVEPDDNVRRLHAIGSEVESNLIRGLSLMRQMVKSGTADGVPSLEEITPVGRLEGREEPAHRSKVSWIRTG